MIEDEKAKSPHTEVWSEKMRTPDEVAALREPPMPVTRAHDQRNR